MSADVKSYRKDGSRSAEVDSQKQASNHFKWLLLRAVIISVEVTCGHDPC